MHLIRIYIINIIIIIIIIIINTKVSYAKTCKFIYSKGCKTPLMICYFSLLT